MSKTQSKLDFIPPAFNPLVLRLVHWSLPLLRRIRFKPWLPAGIGQIEIINGETLVKLLQQFQIGKIRLILAFRHCEVDDPLSGLYLFSRGVPQIARQSGITLQYPIHSHFIYDRGMTIWAGNWLGWLFSRIGGVPVHRGKSLDLPAIKKVRDLLINGQFPLTIAPEGGTNGHSDRVSPLEPGVSQLGFWCAEDLQKANRYELVIILPINLQYRYIHPKWSKLDKLLRQLETDCGLASPPISQTDDNFDIYLSRIFSLGEYLISEMERFYHRFYRFPLPQHPSPDTSANLNLRLQALLDISLKVGENYFGLKTKGNIIERCRRLEEAGWNYIYRQEKQTNLSPVKQGLDNWIAGEAENVMRHMRLVESFVAVDDTYLLENPCFERFAEISLILYDAIARIKGQSNPRRPRLGWRKSTITIGQPINLSDRLSTYQQNRTTAKQAVNKLTQDLQVALENL
ncbi:MAG: 1-acyl-sn-glycerol-3-phosphate acyltransferase [Pleurocapsa sp.]